MAPYNYIMLYILPVRKVLCEKIFFNENLCNRSFVNCFELFQLGPATLQFLLQMMIVTGWNMLILGPATLQFLIQMMIVTGWNMLILVQCSGEYHSI